MKVVVTNRIFSPMVLGLFLSIWENSGISYFLADKRGPLSPVFHLLRHLVFPLMCAPLCPPYCWRKSHIKFWKCGPSWFMLISPQEPELLWDSDTQLFKLWGLEDMILCVKSFFFSFLSWREMFKFCLGNIWMQPLSTVWWSFRFGVASWYFISPTHS